MEIFFMIFNITKSILLLIKRGVLKIGLFLPHNSEREKDRPVASAIHKLQANVPDPRRRVESSLNIRRL